MLQLRSGAAKYFFKKGNQTSKILLTPMLKHPHAQHSHHKARDPGPPPFPGHMAPLYHPHPPPPIKDTLLLIITHCLESLLCSLSGTPDWQQDLSLDDYNDLTFLLCLYFYS